MISLDRYAELLSSREVRLTFAASLLGRLPVGMTGLAILMLTQHATASFAQGGAATGCYVAGLAIASPALGRWIDRRGPTGIMLACALLFPAALMFLILALSRNWSAATLVAPTLAGTFFPPITVCMRSYLKRRMSSGPMLSTAYSLESVLIELMFILGPMLVAVIVAFSAPSIAVMVSAAFGLCGALLFLRSPAMIEWKIEPRAASHASLLGPLSEPGFPTLVALVLCYSMAFGLLEIAIAGHATEIGHPAVAGVLLGIMSAGSAVGGLAYGSRTWGAPLSRQFAWMLGAMGLGLGLLTLGWGPWGFGFLCALAGVAMAPALIVQSMLVAQHSRTEHATEAFTWSASALLGGIGLGMALGGWILESAPSSSALAAGAACAMAASAGSRLLPRRAAER